MRREAVATACAACVLAVAGAPAAATAGLDPARFSDPATIDNAWFPLAPGTQFTLAGSANRGEGQRRHRVVFTVPAPPPPPPPPRALVLWDRDYNGGRLEEGELTFHAQDDAGTVWNLGEYPEEYEHGRLTGAPDTWIAGLSRARAGILMLADPHVGTPSYLQGWAPDIGFADRARVLRTGVRSCVPVRCYGDVLVTDEWNPAEPGAHQRKFYTRGVGNIRVGAAGHDTEGEVLVLERVRHMSAGARSWVRKEALKLDRRAYRVKADLYRHTPPAEPMTAP